MDRRVSLLYNKPYDNDNEQYISQRTKWTDFEKRKTFQILLVDTFLRL